MLEVVCLGFWIIWSSDREVYPLSESLWFTLIAVILRQLTAFDLPIIDTYWMIFNGIIWAFCRVDFRHCRPYRQQFYYFLRVGDDGRYRLFSIVATFAGLVGQIFGLTVSDG